MVCNSIADYENFYPKNKKEIPKGKEQKSESKGAFLSLSFFYNGVILLFSCFFSCHVVREKFLENGVYFYNFRNSQVIIGRLDFFISSNAMKNNNNNDVL